MANLVIWPAGDGTNAAVYIASKICVSILMMCYTIYNCWCSLTVDAKVAGWCWVSPRRRNFPYIGAEEKHIDSLSQYSLDINAETNVMLSFVLSLAAGASYTIIAGAAAAATLPEKFSIVCSCLFAVNIYVHFCFVCDSIAGCSFSSNFFFFSASRAGYHTTTLWSLHAPIKCRAPCYIGEGGIRKWSVL